MWYISFQGETDGGIDNIYAYDDDGTPLADPAVLPLVGPALSELRGFELQDRLLYVLNAQREISQVLIYADTGLGYEFAGCLAAAGSVNSILHPYDLTFDDAGNCYVSSQDTNVVTGIAPDGTALPVAPHLVEKHPPPAQFLAGTRVASAEGKLPHVPKPVPPDVNPPTGLTVQCKDKKVSNSVRGVVALGDALYVADEPAGAVKVYDLATGELRWQIAGDNLSSPGQLVVAPGTTTLYIGSTGNGSVVCYDVSDAPPPGGVATPSTFLGGQVPHVSGMAFDPHGYFYAALRTAKQVLRFDDNGNPATFIDNLPDEPEFLRYVPDST